MILAVSPLMSPILAGVFGAVIQDSKLTMKGVRHEAQVSLNIPTVQCTVQYRTSEFHKM